MSEASFWKYLQKILPKDGHYTRIESHDTASGFPDVHYTLNGTSGTIELKDAKRPGAKYPFSRESGLRRSQVRWIETETEAHGNVNLALQCGDRIYVMRADLYFTTLHITTEKEIARVAQVRWSKKDRPGSYEYCQIQSQIYSLLEESNA